MSSTKGKHPNELRPSDLPVAFVSLDEPRHGLSMTTSIDARTDASLRLHYRPGWDTFRMERTKNGSVEIEWISMGVVARFKFVTADADDALLKRYGLKEVSGE